MDRRELLKKFSIGTLIAPIVGGAAETSAAAKLIEVPKVELVSAQPSGRPLDFRNIKSLTISFENNDGSVGSLICHNPYPRFKGRIESGKRIGMELSLCEYTSPVTVVVDIGGEATVL